MFRVFAITVTYNAEPWIDKCLTSLKHSIYPLIPVVVDNGSQDCTLLRIHRDYPEVVVLENERNLGFGQANNKGIRYALNHGADFVMLLNQDAWIFDDTIEKLVAAAAPEFGIVSPVHFGEEGEELEPNFCNFLTNELLTKSFVDKIAHRSPAIYEVPFVSAAAWLLPKSTLNRIGGFDPLFFHYGEDNDYCNRVLYHGLKIGIVPSAQICHNTQRNGYMVFPGKDERFLKLHCLNLNLPEQEIIQFCKRWRFRMYAQLIRGQIKTFRREKKLYDKLTEVMSQILAHRELHQTEGQHWL